MAWTGSSQADKWQTLPPGTPQAYVDAWRAAFAQLVQDPEYQSLATKQFSEDLVPMFAEDLEQVIQEAVAVSDEAIEYMVNLKKKYGVPVK